MYEMTQEQAHKAWLVAAEKVKDRVIAPTLYRALEVAVGITLEGDQFVLGFSNPDYPMAGHLRSAQHNAIIVQSISEVLKKSVRLLIIEGATLADYENYKALQAMSEAESATMSERRARERAAELAWEETAEKITRGYARLRLRNLAQSKGKFIREALVTINDAVNRLGYVQGADELQERALARVFEKLATAIEVPSALLAYEFFKLRDEGKLS